MRVLHMTEKPPPLLCVLQMLTLVSNERIPLSESMRMIFEIHSLKNATPATVRPPCVGDHTHNTHTHTLPLCTPATHTLPCIQSSSTGPPM